MRNVHNKVTTNTYGAHLKINVQSSPTFLAAPLEILSVNSLYLGMYLDQQIQSQCQRPFAQQVTM